MISSQKVSWKSLMRCRPHHDSCAQHLKWQYPRRPSTYLSLELVSVLSLIQSQGGLEDFPFSFPGLHIPLSYKSTSLEETNCPQAISCLISEPILVFLYLQIFLKASGKSHTPIMLALSKSSRFALPNSHFHLSLFILYPWTFFFLFIIQ